MSVERLHEAPRVRNLSSWLHLYLCRGSTSTWFKFGP
jgi:hypothetical protein